MTATTDLPRRAAIVDRARRHPALLAAFWVASAALLQLLRSRGAPPWDTIWAEDGEYFLSEALQDPWGSLAAPLAGYLQVPGRLIAALAASLRLDWASEVFAVGSALVVGLLSLYVFFASREVIRPPLPRAVLAALIALLPAAVIESTANSANLQYFLLFACFWALVHEPRDRLETVAGSAVVVAAGLNTVFAWLYLPLVAQQWGRSGRFRRVVLGSFGAAVAVQVVAVVFAVVFGGDPTLDRYPLRWTGSDIAELPGIYGLRVVVGLLMGSWELSAAWDALGWSLVAAASLLVGTTLVLGFRAVTSSRPWIAVLSVYSLLMLSAPAVIRGTSHLASDPSSVQVAGARYTLTPIWFLYAALAAALWAPDASARWARVARTVLVVVMAYTMISSFSQETFRSSGPRWSVELDAARKLCRTAPGGRVSLPITPYEPWDVRTTCEDIIR